MNILGTLNMNVPNQFSICTFEQKICVMVTLFNVIWQKLFADNDKFKFLVDWLARHYSTISAQHLVHRLGHIDTSKDYFWYWFPAFSKVLPLLSLIGSKNMEWYVEVTSIVTVISYYSGVTTLVFQSTFSSAASNLFRDRTYLFWLVFLALQ